MGIEQVVGIFNIFVGLMLVAAFLMMGGGIILWIVRFGVWPSYRDDAIKTMQMAVTILFTLVVLLGVAKFVQNHTATAMYVAGLIIVGVVIFVGVTLFVRGGGDDEAKH